MISLTFANWIFFGAKSHYSLLNLVLREPASVNGHIWRNEMNFFQACSKKFFPPFSYLLAPSRPILNQTIIWNCKVILASNRGHFIIQQMEMDGLFCATCVIRVAATASCVYNCMRPIIRLPLAMDLHDSRRRKDATFLVHLLCFNLDGQTCPSQFFSPGDRFKI